jgi:hypothetical protein
MDGSVKIRCVRCREEKPDDGFHVSRHRNNGLQSHCKKCDRARVNDLRRKFKQKVVEYKGGECQRCGGRFHPQVFDLHHRDRSQKDFSVSSYRKWTDAVVAEIDKCDLLCANCHRLEHRDLHLEGENAT